MTRLSGRILLAAVLAGFGGPGRIATAQDDADPDKEPLAQPVPERVTAEEQVESVFFGPGEMDSLRARFESRLASEVEAIDRVARLTPDQRRKLLAAGHGDIKHHFDQFRETVAPFVRRLFEIPDGQFAERFGRRGMARAQMERLAILDRLRFERPDVQRLDFGPGSLLAKTLPNTLTREQRARFDVAVRTAPYRTRVSWVIFPLDRELKLSRRQHEQFVSVIVAETRPLLRYGELDDDAVLLQAAAISEAKLKPIFTEDQWRRLQGRFETAKLMEKIVMENGYLELAPSEPGRRGVERQRARFNEP
jgi:hypothetical protein